MSAAPRYDGVLLIGFGGPASPAEVRPFLDRVLRGRPIPRERYEEVVHHYEAIGGCSPYNELTMAQTEALRQSLLRAGVDLPVFVGMRNSAPDLASALNQMAGQSVRRALGFVLAAHRCEASFGRYVDAVRDAQTRMGDGAPSIEYVGPWHTHRLFIEAASARIREALERLAGSDRSQAQLVFTAHSIPVAMAAACGYVDELTETSRLVAGALRRDSWTLAFQSRSGNPREPWLEPEIGATLRKLDSRAAVVVPIGFLCDHVEVLYDLDIEAAGIARAAGVQMVRAATVGTHPRFIEMMADVIRASLRSR